MCWPWLTGGSRVITTLAVFTATDRLDCIALAESAAIRLRPVPGFGALHLEAPSLEYC